MPDVPPELLARNAAAALRFVEGVLGGGEPAAFAEIVHPDVVVDTGLQPSGPIRGRDAYGRVLTETLGAAFSDGSLRVLDLTPLVDGRVLVRFEAEADNTGPLNGVPATGRRFTFHEMHLMRFADGLLVENLVGALNPLMFELWQAPASAPLVLGPSEFGSPQLGPPELVSQTGSRP